MKAFTRRTYFNATTQKKKKEGSQINSWKFKAHISWSQSDGDKMDYLLCANK